MSYWLFKTYSGTYRLNARLSECIENLETWRVRRLIYREQIKPGADLLIPPTLL